ncbi:MAG: ParB N-terminal domain-containing protein, partial [Planctomycetales bacterium]|nr:ParB N-terminal domain-containing protein [Planctomycetales bacterium]
MTTHIDIPLSQLKLSPTNVRTDPGDVRTLARSIQSIGLINPLAVTENGRGWLVEAGGRRLAALQLLRDNGHFAKDEPIPCTVFDSPSVARSLAENHERAPMDAVQQFQAFDRLIGEGHTVHEVAETFSV